MFSVPINSLHLEMKTAMCGIIHSLNLAYLKFQQSFIIKLSTLKVWIQCKAANTWRLLLCTEIDLSFFNSFSNEYFLLLYVRNKHRSCKWLILFLVLLKKSKQVSHKLRNNKIIDILFIATPIYSRCNSR